MDVVDALIHAVAGTAAVLLLIPVLDGWRLGVTVGIVATLLIGVPAASVLWMIYDDVTRSL